MFTLLESALFTEDSKLKFSCTRTPSKQIDKVKYYTMHVAFESIKSVKPDIHPEAIA